MKGEALDGSGEKAGGSEYPWTPSTLTAIRSRRTWRVGTLLVAAAVGIGLAWVHWLGLFAGGALVGLTSRTLRGAVPAGIALGVLILGLQVLLIPSMEIGEFLALRPPAYVTVGAGIGAPAWGALIRGVV